MNPECVPTFNTPLQTEADYKAAAELFWELLDNGTDLETLLALREVMREYERAHPA